MFRGLLFILLFYFLGEIISILIQGFIPGSIIGMLLLFFSLYFRIINPKSVRKTATTIVNNMVVFLIPPAVGLMAYKDILFDSFWTISLSIIISTILTMLIVGFVQEYLENRAKRKKNN